MCVVCTVVDWHMISLDLEQVVFKLWLIFFVRVMVIVITNALVAG